MRSDREVERLRESVAAWKRLAKAAQELNRMYRCGRGRPHEIDRVLDELETARAAVREKDKENDDGE